MVELRMDGRVALITGGSAGLGKAMAKAFLEAGAKVAILARNQDVLDAAAAEIAEAGGAGGGDRVMAISCDVTDAAKTTESFAAIEARFGQVDVLVNNAGTSRTGKFLEVTDEIWRADFELKLFAAARLCRLAFPGMTQRRWGRIINVLNIGAKAPSAGSAPTSVSRAAGMAMTKVLAGEGAPHNVLVNALLVGFIKSAQWERRHASADTGQSYDDFLQDMVAERAIPLGRVGEAEEFAALACFLASDAGGYVTGTAINVDGGRSPVM